MRGDEGRVREDHRPEGRLHPPHRRRKPRADPRRESAIRAPTSITPPNRRRPRRSPPKDCSRPTNRRNVADLHDWAQRIAEENKYFQTPIYTGVLGYGYNTELLAKYKMPEPKCWKDLVNPAYKNEIQMANPGTSGTAFNTVSTILQLMGEDEGFKFLAAMNKNVNQYTRSGSAGIRAAAKGETTIGITFLHDSVAQTVQGYPIKTVAPCEGTGYEIISSAIIKGGPNPEGAKKWMDFVLSPAGQNVALTVNKFQIPSNKNAQIHPHGAEDCRR